MIILLSLILLFLLPILPRAVGGIFLWVSLPLFSGNGLLGIITLVIAEGISGGIKQEGRDNYYFAKVIGLGSMGFLVLFNVQDSMKIPLIQQITAISIGIFIWGHLIKDSKNKAGAVIGAIGAIALGQIISKLDVPNAIIPLSIALYGIPPLVLSLSGIKEEKVEDMGNPISGMILGAISGIFMGVPPSALAASLDEDKASSEGMASAMGLLMALAGLGARSTVADNISSLGLEIPPSLILVILGISLFSTILGHSLGDRKKDYLPNFKVIKIKSIIGLIASVAIIIYLLGMYGIPLIGAGLFVSKIIRASGSKSELALIGISSIPLIRLFT